MLLDQCRRMVLVMTLLLLLDNERVLYRQELLDRFDKVTVTSGQNQFEHMTFLHWKNAFQYFDIGKSAWSEGRWHIGSRGGCRVTITAGRHDAAGNAAAGMRPHDMMMWPGRAD